ncbi:glycosyltransferase [Shewanella sp. VB17]|uniref:glycosyltransferase n=1 Tax=Shewanella sp. VB17 TaxID=2739432 RepID=UPI001564C19B|nr:glycosyltransferase [Shewanella sp. VB17]NRD72374.1 glycosyltransferase [Shewanella sp. VB17]
MLNNNMKSNLLVVLNEQQLEYQKKIIKKLTSIFPLNSFVVICKKGNIFDVENIRTLTYASNISEINLNIVEDTTYTGVVIVGSSKEDAVLWLPILRDAINKNVEFVSVLNSDFELIPYRLMERGLSKVISVFPGPMVPLNMGSHQRAFNLLLHLNQSGIRTDALITAGKPEHAERAKGLLETICPRVYTYKNNKRKLSRYLIIRRWLEKKSRNILGYKKPVAELFEDRLDNKATYSAQVTLARVLTENDYQYVIVNYAWMNNVKALVPESVKNKIIWICDTHDVQFQRNKTQNESDLRLFYSTKRENKLECKVLNEYDHVLAISKPDKECLSKVLNKAKVSLVVSGFDYAFIPAKNKVGNKPFNFGFIGGKMEANVRSVEHILNFWWPEIKKLSPDSKFYIAGSICNVDRIKNLVFFDSSIVCLGFVDSLRAYYSKFDISLNPVFVQGGLNFKSVEALSSGKILFTNTMGIQCLQDKKVAFVIDNTEQLLSKLMSLESNKQFQLSSFRNGQKRALEIFSDHNAYSKLKDIILMGEHK